MRHKECLHLLGKPLISGRPSHSNGDVTTKMDREVGIPWYLELQEALVTLGAVSVRGKPQNDRSDKDSLSLDKPRSGWSYNCDQKVNLG